MLEPSTLIPVKLCSFSMLLQGVILCQSLLTIARRVSGKPCISIQITTVWPRYSSLGATLEWIYLFQLDEIENFLNLEYYGEVSMETLDVLRMNQFQRSTNNSLRTLPQLRDGLTEHVKHACLQGGYEWRALVEDVDFIAPIHWSWRFMDNRYIPKWLDSSDTVDVNYLIQVCSCKKGVYKNCKCTKTRSTACLTVGVIRNV